MDRWQTYLPVSSAALLPIFGGAIQKKTQFSLTERALFVACEFWTAVGARTLVAHVGSDAVETLRYMSILYLAIGAHGVANDMMIAVDELVSVSVSVSDPRTQRQCLIKLQNNLLKTRDPVDPLIARLAEKLRLGSGGRRNWEKGTEEIAIVA
jgi:hypothetical protein